MIRKIINEVIVTDVKNDESKYTDREKSLMRLHNQQLQMNKESFDELADENTKLHKELNQARKDYKELLNTKDNLKKLRKLEDALESYKNKEAWIISTVKEFANELEDVYGSPDL